MYVPDEYTPPDPSWVTDLVHRNPLALLASNGAGAPHATHVPVIPQSETPSADLRGTVLIGHMNRANLHWRALAGGGPALLVFTGPHGYVSPSVYRTTPAAPTWNFTAVHVRGHLRPLTGRSETIDVIKATVRRLESRFGTGWDMTASLDYFARILPGVGAFELTVDSAEAMFKLSQEQTPEIRAHVHRSFANSDSTVHNRLSELMSTLDGSPDGSRSAYARRA
jgi:transcriptional regulator